MVKFITLLSIVLLAVLACNTNEITQKTNSIITQYTCIPCGYDCDTTIFTSPGTCSTCKMDLVKKESIFHKNSTIDSLCNFEDSKTIFLDVRTVEEFEGTTPDKFGAIKNAINIPLQELEKRRIELVKYKDKNIVVYCSHAHRSALASYQLTQNGFSNVNNMLGGMSVWNEKMKANNCLLKLFLHQ